MGQEIRFLLLNSRNAAAVKWTRLKLVRMIRQPKDASGWRARTTPLRRGAALDTFRPLDREQELSRGRPKRVDCRGSRCAWNDLKTSSTPAC